MQLLAEYVIRNRKQAIFAALLLAIIPLCGWLSLSIVGLITLRKGALEGLYILLGTAVPAILYAFKGQPLLLLNDVLLGSVVVWGMALILRLTSSWSLLIQLTSLFAVIVLGLVLLAYPNILLEWERLLTKTLEIVNNASVNLGLSVSKQKLLLHNFAQVATGFYAAVVIVSNLTSLVYARWLQSLLFNPGGLPQELCKIRLGIIANLSLVLLLVAIKADNIFALNVIFIFITAFVCSGVSVIHRLFAKTPKAQFWLIGFYILSVLFFPASLILIGLVAFIDGWNGFSRWEQFS